MDEIANMFLMLIAATFIFLVAFICVLSYQSDNREQRTCQIEGMRANRTVLEIKEICK